MSFVTTSHGRAPAVDDQLPGPSSGVIRLLMLGGFEVSSAGSVHALPLAVQRLLAFVAGIAVLSSCDAGSATRVPEFGGLPGTGGIGSGGGIEGGGAGGGWHAVSQPVALKAGRAAPWCGLWC